MYVVQLQSTWIASFSTQEQVGSKAVGSVLTNNKHNM